MNWGWGHNKHSIHINHQNINHPACHCYCPMVYLRFAKVYFSSLLSYCLFFLAELNKSVKSIKFHIPIWKVEINILMRLLKINSYNSKKYREYIKGSEILPLYLEAINLDPHPQRAAAYISSEKKSVF